MILIHDLLPCSEGFFKLLRTSEEKKGQAESPISSISLHFPDIQIDNSDVKVSSIKSPKYSLGLSPINRFMNVHSPKEANTPLSYLDSDKSFPHLAPAS